MKSRSLIGYFYVAGRGRRRRSEVNHGISKSFCFPWDRLKAWERRRVQWAFSLCRRLFAKLLLLVAYDTEDQRCNSINVEVHIS